MEEDKLLCACLYETIIEEESDCVFQPEGEATLYGAYSIDYTNDLLELLNGDYDESFINGVYERLVILTNEQLNFGDEIYSRVARIIFEDYILDLTDLFYNLDISIWSNGNIHTGRQNYIFYHKGKHIYSTDCPPTYGEIREIINRKMAGGSVTDFESEDVNENLERFDY
jgi:hypothetical protein